MTTPSNQQRKKGGRLSHRQGLLSQAVQERVVVVSRPQMTFFCSHQSFSSLVEALHFQERQTMQKTKEKGTKVQTTKTNQKSEAICLIIPLCPFLKP